MGRHNAQNNTGKLPALHRVCKSTRLDKRNSLRSNNVPRSGAKYGFNIDVSTIMDGLQKAGDSRQPSSLDSNAPRVIKHLDVVCQWDKGQPELDTSELSDNMRHSRLTYTWALFRATQKIHPTDLAAWQTFKSSTLVDIDGFVEWISTLIPRSIHDLKPLLVLTQVNFLSRCVFELVSAD
ncbi:hypothetical protein CYMTET_16436 [Cymbomonas tetramitiformis]|uniref:Uncharacterized protein n=1 Tax=Cymbomonas tetramitiformis TaxID=36881 RepID=A0AAE0L809_9CHLO|nr:hypothetical protein CYMTET_16436 [Cymbomonas tetramitiformis]